MTDLFILVDSIRCLTANKYLVWTFGFERVRFPGFGFYYGGSIWFASAKAELFGHSVVRYLGVMKDNLGVIKDYWEW